jgi:RHS repeat-associated protein
MTGHSTSRCASWRSLLLAGVVSAAVLAQARAYQFKLGDVTVDLQEVTTNVDVHFRAMRFNRAANEWDVDVTVSNKSALTISVPLVYLVDGVTGTSGPLRPDGVSTNQAYYDLSGQIPNGVLAPGTVSAARTLGLGFTTNQAPTLVARLFAGIRTNTSEALAFVRSLNQAGQPLPGVNVQETGPAAAATNLTDSVFGVATLGQSPGNYVWEFSQAGYLPVWRQASLQSNTVAVIPYPWLSARSPQTFTVSPLLGGTASNQTVAVRFGPGSVAQQAAVQLTELSSQTLPLFLPQGWSPLEAFWLQSSVAPARPVPASLIPWGPIGSAEDAVLVEFSSTPLGWQVLQLVPGNDTNAVSVSLPGAGAYALVVADTAPSAPPAPSVGSLLEPGNAPLVDQTNLLAVGTVTPAASPASLVPALVTADADLTVSNVAGSLPSGTLLKGRVSESYLLNDGTTRVPPFYGNSIMAYQRPGQPQLGVLHAHFPMSPVLLFGSDQLNQGVVHVDLFPAGPFTGGVLDTNGGVIANAGLRLLVAPGVLATREAVQLHRVSPTNFTGLTGTNFSVVAAFEVAVGPLPPASELFLQSTGVPPTTTLVLARVRTDQGLYGLEPRTRLQSDVNGNLLSAEPTVGDRLPGLAGSGEYVLLQAQPQQALVEGIAKNAAGQPAGGLPVRVTGQPWLTFSAPDGSFKLLAPAGAGSLTVSDVATGDTGSQTINVSTNLASLSASVAVVGGGPQVASITPADSSTNVPQVSPVVINFNRPINPATLMSNAVQLLESNQPVAATFSLNLADTTVTLLPSAPLDAATQFTLVLATNITDTIGRPLEGQSQFSFTTLALSARDPAAQLIIYAPGATNLATNVVADLPGFIPGTNASLIVVHGTSGCADPGVPVLVVNEGSGDTTTVLSKPDGSFTSFVSGQEQDFISATFISLNGARLYVPVNRQLFDDGTVGLYQQGGALQAQGDGGPVQVTVPPNALASRAKFKLISVTAPELQTQLGGIIPSNGVVAGSALNLNIQGAIPTLPLQVSFPVDLTAAGYPTNEPPTNAAAAVTIVTTNQNVTAFQVVGQAFFQPNPASQVRPGLQAGSRPKGGPRPKGGGRPLGGSQQQTAVGALNAALQLSGVGGLAQFGLQNVIVPILFNPLLYGQLPVTVKGLVAYVPANVVAQVNAGQRLAGAQSLVGLGVSFAGPLGAVAGQVIFGASAVADWQLTTAEMNASLPLSGAFVTLNMSGGPLVQEPGRLFPGMVYGVSGADGSFLLVAPQAGYNYLVTATDPIYARVLTIPVNPTSFNLLSPPEINLAGVVFKNFYFSVQTPILTAPTVSVGNVPTQPPAGQPCTVQVVAYQPTGPPAVNVTVASIDTKNLSTGGTVANPQAPITGASTSTNGNSVTWNATITASDPVRVVLLVTAQGQNASQDGSLLYPIEFTGATPTAPSSIPPPPPSDIHGPVVVEVDPPDNGFIGEDSTITITFNKPIDASVTNQPGAFTLGKGGPGTAFLTPILRLSPGQQTLRVQYPGLAGGWTYTLTLTGQYIRDLAGHPLNQVPSSSTPVSFTTSFRTIPTPTAPLPYLVNGRGAVISGTQLYAIDQAPQGNFLRAYDISTPSNPQFEGQLPLVGAPRDLVVIPQFRYVTNYVTPVMPQDVQTNDLVVVVGGNLDATINQVQGTTVTVPGQYLWVVNMGNPKSPQVLASPIVTYEVAEAVTKVRWAPPWVVYQQYGADIQLLGFVNLQEMLIGFGSTPAQIAQFPPNGQMGTNTNSFGTYVDPGDTLPEPPPMPPEFFGKHQSYVLQGTTQPILDFSVINAGQDVGITLRNGLELNATSGQPTTTNLAPCYRTLVSGTPLNIAVPTDAAFPFGATAYPRWVSLFNNLEMVVNGAPLILRVALVSLVPDSDGIEKLAVIDISLPENPRLVNAIPIPTSLLGGDMESVSMRGDGLLELAGSQNLVVLDPSQMAVTNVPAGQLPPCIVEVVTGAGSIQRSLGTSAFGVHAVADSGRAVVVQSPPQLQFVSFPQGNLVDPTALVGEGDASLSQVFAGQRNVGGLAPAHVTPQPSLNIPSDLAPQPNPALHYYVLMVAPGGAGATVDLGLEAVNAAGWPISNLGSGFAPVRAVAFTTQTAIGQIPRPGCGAPIRALTAYRLSSNPNSVYYNYYLSRPFVLITEAVSATEVFTLQNNVGIDREILFGGFSLRAFIDPDQAANNVLGPFAAQADTDRQIIYPVSVVSAPTVDRSYIPGDNPPPPGGATKMPGTYGSICAHSSELRTEATDLVLPSPHMPIEITRAIGDQDSYEGPFGVGWDFNYNQRLTVLNPQTFPQGLQLPLVTRDNAADSVVANSQDVLFHNGMGQTILFQWVSETMPQEYAQDPLVQLADFQTLASDYYLPALGQGVFDLFIQLKDGRFWRLTPGGELYQYTPQGRLEAIVDRFPANFHWLEYDSHGWLTNITDASVSSPRFVQIGYYRHESNANQITDPDFTAGLDMATANPYLNGKICRLRDYAGRDVLYQYTDDGFLTNRMGIQVNGENGGYAGRSHTFYTESGCRLVQVSATVAGTPLLSANSATSSDGKQVVQSTTGIGGPVQLTAPLQNTAASVANQETAAGLADGSATQFTFDKWGNPTSTTVSGPGSPPATTFTTNNEEGLPVFVKFPEGNSKTMTYDTGNPVFRSRANLKVVAFDPGPRGGTAYSETFLYDPRYNLKSGAQQDGNGFTTTYHLSADGRTVTSVDHGSGATETFTYNDNGQLTSSTDVRGIATTMVYDPATGFLRSRTLGGNTYTYTYGSDLASQLGQPASIAFPQGAPMQMAYNANLQPVMIQRDTLVKAFGYDELGHAMYEQEILGDGKVLVANNNYDVKGFLKTNVLSGIEVNGQVTSLEYDFVPDPVSRIQQIIYPQGTVRVFKYDSRGNVTNMTLGDYVELYTLDLNNNVTAVMQGGDLVQTRVYDGFDRPITITRKTGAQDETETDTYYPEGELNSHTLSDPQFGVVQQQTYDQIDELGRTVHLKTAGTTISPAYQYAYASGSVTVTGPRMTTQQTWNTAGYDTGVTQPNLTATIYPDGSGRVTSISRQEDGATYNEFFTYDDLDHRTSTADDLGTLFLYLSRADGCVLGATNAVGHATAYEHSALAELLDVRRQDGMEFRFQHDPVRHPSYNGDPGGGFQFAYDGEFRMTNSTLRSGAATVYGNFDHRNLPQTLSLPGGGTETMVYDLQRRMTDKTVNYLSTAYKTHATYDALDRAPMVTYQQDNGAVNTTTDTYDEAGPLLSAEFQEDVGDFKVQYSYYADGTRNSITYPSGVTVTEQRDTSGRLTGVSDANGNIISASSWQGNKQPKVVQLGTTMQVVNTYDVRGRVTGRRVTRLGDGAVLVHLRYQYDNANNQLIRQSLHRSGKADNLFYDTGERLSEAQVGAVPLTASGFTPPLYDRLYTYDASGLDDLTSTTLATNLIPSLPPFATNWTAHDNFLLPSIVDGFQRGAADPMGNVAQALLQVRPNGAAGTTPVSATLTHNGMGSLVGITRADGLTEQNLFQPSGLRYERRVSQGSQVLDFRHFVYDDLGRLLEEYEQTNGTPNLIGRYYYATGDAPDAADLMDPATGNLKRYYFLKDNMESVVAVADANGVVVERAWYDPFGQPAIEPRDTAAPIIRKVLGGDAGSLWVVLSESVWTTTADPGPGGGPVAFSDLITNIFTVTLTPTNGPAQVVQGTNQWVPVLAGFPPYSVVRFFSTTPAQTLSGPISIALAGGALQDEWGNTNLTQTVAIQATGTVGTVYYAVLPDTQTGPAPLARSSVGSPFLFHGQYFDYDTGLVYLRARFYDPYSGMFFEPDPLGYEDSVNLYAGMGNDPVGFRDPSGLGVAEFFEYLARLRMGARAASTAAEEAATVGRSAEGLDRAVAQGAEDVERAPRAALTDAPMGRVLGGQVLDETERLQALARNPMKSLRLRQGAQDLLRQSAEAAARAAERERQWAAAANEELNRARQIIEGWEKFNISTGFMKRIGGTAEWVSYQLRQRLVLLGSTAEEHELAARCLFQGTEQGAFDVYIHGAGANAVGFKTGEATFSYFNVRQLAKLISAHPGYTRGMKIRLIACRSGQDAEGFAKKLARELQTEVWSPTGKAYPYFREGVKIGPDIYGTPGYLRRFTAD